MGRTYIDILAPTGALCFVALFHLADSHRHTRRPENLKYHFDVLVFTLVVDFCKSKYRTNVSVYLLLFPFFLYDIRHQH
jgi:hypothetical protein